MKNHKKKQHMRKKHKKTQKLWSMKGCSLGRCKQKGGMCNACLKGGTKKRRTKRMLAYPASNSISQQEFQKSYMAYTGKGGSSLVNPNPNLPYGQGQFAPYNNEFPPGVSQPQNLKGGGHIYQPAIYGMNSLNGGSRKKRRGGMSNIGKWPDGLVGSPWTGNVNQWPGVDHISGNRNYLVDNDYKYSVQTEGVINSRNPTLNGGARKKTSKNKRGGFFPQDLVNVGRQFTHFGSSSYNTLMGKPTTPSPMPYKDQFSSTPSNIDFLKF